MMKTLIAAASALALTASPALAAAAANPASSLSVKSAVCAGTPARRGSNLAAPGAIVGLVLAAAVIAGGVLIVADDDDSDSN